MSKNVNIYLYANISGDSTGQNIGTSTTPIATVVGSPAYHAYQAIATGNNLFPIPTTPNAAQFCLIVPSTTSAVIKYIRGAVSDVGLNISSTQPSLISLNPAASTLIINASGSENLDIYFW